MSIYGIFLLQKFLLLLFLVFSILVNVHLVASISFFYSVVFTSVLICNNDKTPMLLSLVFPKRIYVFLHAETDGGV